MLFFRKRYRKLAGAPHVEPIAVLSAREAHHYRFAMGTAKYRSHGSAVKARLAKRALSAATLTNRNCDRHLDRKQLSQESGSRVAVKSRRTVAVLPSRHIILP